METKIRRAVGWAATFAIALGLIAVLRPHVPPLPESAGVALLLAGGALAALLGWTKMRSSAPRAAGAGDSEQARLLLTVGAGCAHPAPLPPGQSLLELVANEMAADAARDSEALQAFYERTLDHIRQKKAAGGDAAAKYDALQV